MSRADRDARTQRQSSHAAISHLQSSGGMRGPAALTTRACAPNGIGTGNLATGRPPCP